MKGGFFQLYIFGRQMMREGERERVEIKIKIKIV